MKTITGQPLREEHLAPAPKKAIVVRMLHNLMGIARSENDADGVLRYLDAIVAVDPEAAEERWLRARLRYHAGRRAEAIADTDWLLKHDPAGIDRDEVQQLRKLLTQPER